MLLPRTVLWVMLGGLLSAVTALAKTDGPGDGLPKKGPPPPQGPVIFTQRFSRWYWRAGGQIHVQLEFQASLRWF
jgi:hypothetical protein